MDQTAGIWSHCLDCAALSDIGLRRANNQDSYKVDLAGNQAEFEQRGHLFVVADGMGAHAAGELASKMATDVIPLDYRKLLDQSPPEAILSAVVDANRQIHTRGQASPEFRGMGTTASTLLLLPSGALVAHVGDSRTYRMRGHRIEQLTFDHSLAWEMQAAGQLPEGEVPAFIPKNIITRSLGPNAAVQVDIEGPFPLEAGDTFVLCSDGLSGMVADDEIGLILHCLPPTEAAQALIDVACLRGGNDNITVIVVRVAGSQIQQPDSVPQSRPHVKSNARPVHPLLWTMLGVSSLATVGLFALGYPIFAMAGLLVAGAAAATILMQRYGGVEQPAADDRRFGRGPYTTTDCTPNADLLARLGELTEKLREATRDETLVVNRATFDTLLAQAAVAAKAGRLADAARAHLSAIMSMMSQLRHQRPASSDSSVFL
jgi:PPM family protein phosphatase